MTLAVPVLEHLDPAAFAAAQRRLFEGQRLRVGSGRAVHAVAWVRWTAGESLPVPACHAGWVGHGVGGDVRPTVDAVTCRRCAVLRPEEAPCGATPTVGATLPLW